MNRPFVKCGGIEVGAIRPDERMDLSVNTHLIEEHFIYQRSEQLTRKYRSKVDNLGRFIVETDFDPMGTNNLERNDSMYWMTHAIHICCVPNLKICSEAIVPIGFPGARASCPRRLIRAALAPSFSI